MDKKEKYLQFTFFNRALGRQKLILLLSSVLHNHLCIKHISNLPATKTTQEEYIKH